MKVSIDFDEDDARSLKALADFLSPSKNSGAGAAGDDGAGCQETDVPDSIQEQSLKFFSKIQDAVIDETRFQTEECDAIQNIFFGIES